MKNFMIKYAVALLLLFATLLTGCTKGDEGVDDITEDDLYVLYEGIKDSDGQLHEFIYHKDEIYDVRVKPNSIVIADEIYVENDIKYVFFRNSENYRRLYYPNYFREGDSILLGNDPSYRSIIEYEVMDDKVYTGQWYGKNWIDGVASDIIQPDRQDNSWDLFAADGTNVYNLFKTSFGYTILKNGQFLYNMHIEAAESEYVEMVDMTYADGHLYMCGLNHNGGAIWRDGELWKTDATPGSYFSSYYRIKVQDGNVYTSGYMYDEYERQVFSLFKNGTSMIKMDLGDEIFNFEIGNEAAYIL